MKIIVIILCLGIIGCGTVSSVRPIGEDKKSMTFSSGGPITTIYGIKMPILYTVLRYRHGLSENTDFHAGVHPTMLILGNLGTDIGLTKHIVHQSGWSPSLSFEGSIYGFYHFNELSTIRAYPEISVIGSYNLMNQAAILYFGVQNMFQFSRPYLVFVPLFGLEFPFKKRFALNLETKWYAPSEESEDRVVDYEIKPFSHGALGVVWGLSYKF